MKINNTLSALAGLVGLVSVATAAEIPTGVIKASEDVVLAGSYPRLDWNITYPESVLEVIEITPEGDVIPKSGLTMQVRSLAADVQRRTTYWNGWRYVYEYEYINVLGQARVNNGLWRTIFNGVQPQVDANRVLWQTELKGGDEVTFRARVNLTGFPLYQSGANSPNVVLLKQGDVPPSYVTWDTQSSLGTHIAPYLDNQGRIDIGPRDVIVAFELTHQMPGSDGDMQDMIMLLTFQSSN